MIIGFLGKKRSGKSFSVKILNEYTNNAFVVRSLGYDLRKLVSILLGIDVFNENIDKEFKTMYFPKYKKTGRQIYQQLGTGAIRNGFHKKAWTDSLMRRYDTALRHNNKIKWAIDDVRYKSDYDAIKERGGLIIKIVRPCNEPKKNIIYYFRRLFRIGEENHSSELSMDKLAYDELIVANNEFELRRGINELLNKHKYLKYE